MPVASGLPRIRQDLAAYGVVTQVISATSFVAAGLAGFGDGAFQSYAIYVLKKANNTTTPPHREQLACATYVSNSGTFTHVAYTAPLAVGDEILLLHPDIAAAVAALGYYVIATGTFTLSDLVEPEDNTRTEPGNHFRGCLIMPVEGAAFHQARLITAYTGAGGIFSLDPGNPFSVLPGLVRYVIIAHQEQFVPLANAVENRIPADVIGNKTDTAITVADNVSSIIRYLKGILPQVIKSTGAAPVVGNTVANWFAAEADIVSIGADNIRNKLHSLELDITGAVGTITIRLYKQIDGVERRVYQQAFTVAADGPGLWIVNGTVGIHEVLRVTAQSSLVGDNGLAIHYDCMLEVM